MDDSPGPDPSLAVSVVRAPRRTLHWALAAVGACGLLLTVWFVSDARSTALAMPGVHVDALDVSRLDREQIEAKLRAWLEQRSAQPVALVLSGHALSFDPKSVGFSADITGTTGRALSAGRQGNFLGNFLGFVGRWFRPEVVPLELRFDPALLAQRLAEWQASAIGDPPFDGGIAVADGGVSPLYPHGGTRIDAKPAEAQLKRAIRGGSASEPLATRTEQPSVDRSEVDRVVVEARAMLSDPVQLVADNDRQLLLTPNELGSLLRARVVAGQAKLELECSSEALQQLIEPRRAQLEAPAKNARFVIDPQDRVHVEPGHAGTLVDDQALALGLCAAARKPSKKGELTLSPGAEPALSTEAAEHAGVTGLVGTYTTRHACCQPRVENIHHIADLLDGTLVKPGETYSVNQVIGPRSIKNGFRPAPSIEDGDMVDTVGGGVSQFATTLFNALFYGGYDIIERQPHSYWFTRYPMGYDATLSYPHPDIIFKNDTEACALIKTEYTDTSITVKIYGNNGGRKVRAEVSPRQNIVSPPVEFIPNPRLDADEEKTREGGMIGWTVTVKRTLTFPDGKIKEERRKVTYKPRARRVEVHPCRIPAGEPGHTGERCPVPDKDDTGGSSEPAESGAK